MDLFGVPWLIIGFETSAAPNGGSARRLSDTQHSHSVTELATSRQRIRATVSCMQASIFLNDRPASLSRSP